MAVKDDPATAIFLFAWVAEGTPWSEALARCDEDVFAFEITHQENEAATMNLDVENPRIGLLAAGRNLWGWLTERVEETGDLRPLFFGRLMGVPEDIQDEIVRLQFQAKPTDYTAQQEALAAPLRVLPYYDRVWLADGADADPVNVLETRPLAWCVDRITLEVSLSDIGQGEDGTITLTGDDHFYDGLKVDPGQAPLTAINVDATVTWTQEGAGDVDLTQKLYDAFVATGTPFQYPVVGSFTSDGLLSNWPQPGASIGAGWSMGEAAFAETVTWQQPASKKVRYVEKPVTVPTAYQVATDWFQLGGLLLPTLAWQQLQAGITERPDQLFTLSEEAALGWKNWDVLFQIGPIYFNFPVHYETSRARTEKVTFTLTAGVQPILTDAAGNDVEVLSFASSSITNAVDDGGAVPLTDIARNSYFPTDRGQASLQYVMLVARCHAYVRARAIDITVEPVWDAVAGLVTLRQNLLVHDPRLPGGQAVGKITAYTLASEGSQNVKRASVTIGCMVGTGEVLDDVDAPADTYADDYSAGYDELLPGGAVPIIAGELQYTSFDGAYVVDDDGLDLLNMTAGNVVSDLEIINGVSVQETAINDASKTDPVAGLRAFPTQVSLSLVPMTGASFETDYPVDVAQLVLPKSVDLAAPAFP
jgi:hypothetical protein